MTLTQTEERSLRALAIKLDNACMYVEALELDAMCDAAEVVKVPSIERGCSGKARMGSDFKAYADELALCHGKQYAVYRCPHCGDTHCTTKISGCDKYPPVLYVTRDVVSVERDANMSKEAG
jgi:hypothetical protein